MKLHHKPEQLNLTQWFVLLSTNFPSEQAIPAGIQFATFKLLSYTPSKVKEGLTCPQTINITLLTADVSSRPIELQ